MKRKIAPIKPPKDQPVAVYDVTLRPGVSENQSVVIMNRLSLLSQFMIKMIDQEQVLHYKVFSDQRSMLEAYLRQCQHIAAWRFEMDVKEADDEG